MPSAGVRAWRLEQTVDAISSSFEHYLSWTVGVLIDHVNARLTTAKARALLRHDTAWCIRYGVDTPQALALLTEGIRSRRLAHRVGRVSAKRGMNMEDLRRWLAELHIAGWREQFDATPREVLDLLELTRSRRQSLLRSLLEHGRATVELRSPVVASKSDGARHDVTIMPADMPPAELRIFEGDQVIGVIGASSHSDVEAVLASGLDVTIELRGTATIVLTATDVIASTVPEPHGEDAPINAEPA